MPLVAAKCTQCGSNLEIDSGLDAATCPHCHTAFVTEKAINNYNTYQQNTYEIQHANIQINDERSTENRLKSAEVFLTAHKDYRKAEELFLSVSNDAPGNYRGWWGIVQAVTEDFSVFNLSAYGKGKSYLTRAVNVCPADVHEQISAQWNAYERQVEAAVNENQQAVDEAVAKSEALRKEQEALNGSQSSLNKQCTEKNKALGKTTNTRNAMQIGIGWLAVGVALLFLAIPIAPLLVGFGVVFTIWSVASKAALRASIQRLNGELAETQQKLQTVSQQLSEEYRRIEGLKSNLPQQFYEIKNS